MNDIHVTLHPVCSSEFIEQNWLNYISKYGKGASWWWLQLRDFRKWSVAIFNLLQSLCSLSNLTVNDAIDQMLSTALISTEAMPKDQFFIQIYQVLDSLAQTTSTLFVIPLELFRASDKGNAFVSLLGTNWLIAYGRNESLAPLQSISVTYRNRSCSCATLPNCVEPAGLYNLTLHRVYEIEGLVFGCYMIESILQSSLSCFFSNSCLAQLQASMILRDPSTTTSVRYVNTLSNCTLIQQLSFSSE